MATFAASPLGASRAFLRPHVVASRVSRPRALAPPFPLPRGSSRRPRHHLREGCSGRASRPPPRAVARPLARRLRLAHHPRGHHADMDRAPRLRELRVLRQPHPSRRGALRPRVRDVGRRALGQRRRPPAPRPALLHHPDHGSLPRHSAVTPGRGPPRGVPQHASSPRRILFGLVATAVAASVCVRPRLSHARRRLSPDGDGWKSRRRAHGEEHRRRTQLRRRREHLGVSPGAFAAGITADNFFACVFPNRVAGWAARHSPAESGRRRRRRRRRRGGLDLHG